MQVANPVSPALPYITNGGPYFPPAPNTPAIVSPMIKEMFQALSGPRVPLGVNNGLSPVLPMSHQSAGPPRYYSPRDPRQFLQPPPMLPFQPSAIEEHRRQRSPPRRASRSQQASRRRRSATSGSSDSEVAEEISARILGSSGNPREIKSIIKGRKKLVRNNKSSAPAVRVKRRSYSVTPPAMSHSHQDEEIPAALDDDYFNEESPGRRVSVGRGGRIKNTQTFHSAMIVVPSKRAGGISSAAAAKRVSQKDQLGEKIQTFWNPESVVTGKRQRLPPLDWRKGEVYLRAPDGTVIGKEGFANLVFDDMSGVKKNITRKKKQKSSSVSADRGESTAAEEQTLPTLINAFDHMQKDADGIYCLGSHKLLHRSSDRSWGPKMEDQGGFRLAPSIVTDDAFIAEIALEPGCASGREHETVPANQTMYGRVLQAAAQAVRIHVNGREERLSEEDEFFLDEGCKYMIQNLSLERTAVLSLTAFS